MGVTLTMTVMVTVAQTIAKVNSSGKMEMLLTIAVVEVLKKLANVLMINANVQRRR